MIHPRKKHFQRAIALFALCFVLIPIAANAQDSLATPPAGGAAALKAFEFYPVETGYGTYVAPKMNPGDIKVIEMRVSNTGEVAQEIRAYSINAFSGENGGFTAADSGTAPNAVTDWLDFQEQTVALDPGESETFTFSIKVPEDADPGEYITAVAAEQANPSPVEGSVNFTQQLRFAIPVFITVPGETSASFEIGDVTLRSDGDIFQMNIGIANTGDVRLRPEGTVEVLDQSGNLLVSFPVKMDSVYARDSTDIALGMQGSIPPGPYTVRVALSDPETGASDKAEQTGLTTDESSIASSPLVITSATATPKPAADNVQFVQVEATIQNSGDPVANAQLSLVATKDGVEVERFPISQSLSLPTGDTPISTRYLPADGWTTGIWTFELLLESVDPSGAAVVLGRLPVDGTVTIP